MIIFLIAGLLILILLTFLGILIYSGLFTKIDVGAGPPPIKNVKIAYKFGRGPYYNVGSTFTEIVSLAPKERCLGIYYDDPKQVSSVSIKVVQAT